MNLVFTAQGAGLRIFYDLLHKIKEAINIETVGCYVAHSMFYDRFKKEHPDIELEYMVVKEWEVVKESKRQSPRLNKIRAYEKALGGNTLWDSLVCDRRIYLGKRCDEKQDYRPHLRHEEMLSILDACLEKLDKLLDRVEPDVILSLDPVTFGDYLLYLFAQARQIPILFFRTTKIRNYVAFDEALYGCSPHIRRLFEEYENGECAHDKWVAEAREYLDGAGRENIRYEGMIPIPSKRWESSKRNGARSLVGGLMSEIEYLLRYRGDNHIPGLARPYFYKRFVLPVKTRVNDWRFSRYYTSEREPESTDYAFYPLQSEPEIASLIWGRSYMNQIETARNIARSLPVGMKLAVKEHPRSVGYRTSGYYRKILEIPNVLMLHPNQEVAPIIEKSRLVIAVASFVAFEALIYRKPCLMLGGPRPFCILPDSMIRHVKSINDLPGEIAHLLGTYQYREGPLLHYIAATMKGSVPIDYFTTLLQKQGRYGNSGRSELGGEIDKMGRYTIRRIWDVIQKPNLRRDTPLSA